jgi:hypothetical protein
MDIEVGCVASHGEDDLNVEIVFTTGTLTQIRMQLTMDEAKELYDELGTSLDAAKDYLEGGDTD